VPEWVFLPRILGEVVLSDREARRASTRSHKAALARRALLGAAAAISLVTGALWSVSFVGNRDLQRTAIEALRPAPRGDGEPGLSSLEGLRRLDALRTLIETLAEYDRTGPPRRLGWGLYTGARFYPDLRRAYFQRFHELLFADAEGTLLGALRRLPATPGTGDDYSAAYDALKAYLIVHPEYARSTRSFLSPALTTALATQQAAPNAERATLVRRQLDFYADALAAENPYSTEIDAAAVKRARGYLAQFNATDSVYAAMVAEASRSAPSINFNRDFPGSAPFVVDAKDIPGAFTKAGWAFVQGALKSPDRAFGGEPWVLGAADDAADPGRSAAALLERYRADFIATWRGYLASAAVTKFTTLPAAVAALVLGDAIETLFDDPAMYWYVGIFFLCTGALLLVAERFARHPVPSGRHARKQDVNEVKIGQALVIGVMQAAAIPPGISRSGSTIVGGMLSGLNRATAAKFSFMMSVPAILGSLVFESRDLLRGGLSTVPTEGWIAPLVGVLVAAVSGYLAIRWMLRLVQRVSLSWFALYMGVLGSLVLIDHFFFHWVIQ